MQFEINIIAAHLNSSWLQFGRLKRQDSDSFTQASGGQRAVLASISLMEFWRLETALVTPEITESGQLERAFCRAFAWNSPDAFAGVSRSGNSEDMLLAVQLSDRGISAVYTLIINALKQFIHQIIQRQNNFFPKNINKKYF
ncbi:Hypothetical_protein [Hexamita inflata]|uniref:Hypothetical_protein n=1 Tax=Hexamita inflata TaxID=28002 RepID=A0ABP1GVC3_9EUKA